ncbi:MAG: twin-arginine translocation signal domain-containing protein [Candidatus Binatia bacterium]
MKDENTGKVSRRAFLKGLGGGAIGTAVISTGLVKSEPAEAYSPENAGGTGTRKTLNLKINGKSYKVESSIATRWLKSCAISWGSPAPRSVATAASAAPAR